MYACALDTIFLVRFLRIHKNRCLNSKQTAITIQKLSRFRQPDNSPLVLSYQTNVNNDLAQYHRLIIIAWILVKVRGTIIQRIRYIIIILQKQINRFGWIKVTIS